MIHEKISAAIVAGSIVLASTAPAFAWCGPYGCDGYYDYDNGGAAIGGMVAGMALGAIIAGAAAQSQARQYQPPLCTARNGNQYYARATRGQWRC
ncbi:MAG: hypothetical protein WBE80_10175 [Methylocella sp.]